MPGPLAVPTSLRLSRHLRVAGVVVFVLAAVACGATEDEASTPTDVVTAPSSSSTTPTDPAMFQDTLARLTEEIGGAGNDLCALIGVLDGAGAAGNPNTPEQAASAATFLGLAYGKIADALPDPDSADAETIRVAAAGMADEVDEPGFDAEEFGREGPSAFSDKEFLAAMSNVSTTISEQCPDGAG